MQTNAKKLVLLTVLLAAAAGPLLAARPSPETSPPIATAFDRAAQVVRSAGMPGELVVTDVSGA